MNKEKSYSEPTFKGIIMKKQGNNLEKIQRNNIENLAKKSELCMNKSRELPNHI